MIKIESPLCFPKPQNDDEIPEIGWNVIKYFSKLFPQYLSVLRNRIINRTVREIEKTKKSTFTTLFYDEWLFWNSGSECKVHLTVLVETKK